MQKALRKIRASKCDANSVYDLHASYPFLCTFFSSYTPGREVTA